MSLPDYYKDDSIVEKTEPKPEIKDFKGSEEVDAIYFLVSELRKEYEKLMTKSNSSAGARGRKICQEIKTKCNNIRIAMQNERNSLK